MSRYFCFWFETKFCVEYQWYRFNFWLAISQFYFIYKFKQLKLDFTYLPDIEYVQVVKTICALINVGICSSCQDYIRSNKCKNQTTIVDFFSENVKPKKPIDLTILKADQQDLLDDASLDSDEDDEDDKDDLDDLGDDTELADDPNTEDDEEDEDDYDEGDDWDTTPSSTTYVPKPSTTTSAPTTTTKNTPLPTPDPYFTHFDPRNEHQSYKEAQVSLKIVLWRLDVTLCIFRSASKKPIERK